MRIEEYNAFLKKTPPAYFEGRENEPGKRIGEMIKSSNPEDVSEFDCVLIGIPEYMGIVANGGKISIASDVKTETQLENLIANGGPDAVRRRLYSMTPGSFQESVSSRLKIGDLGDIHFDTGDLYQALDRLGFVLREVYRKNVIPIVIGGGHHISIASIGAMAKVRATESIGIGVMDAHCDFRSYEEGQVHSGVPFRFLRDYHSNISGSAFVEFGLRPERNAVQYIQDLKEWGATLVPLDKCRDQGPEEMLKINTGAENVFLSVDIDAFDIRGASASYPGGLKAEIGRKAGLLYGSNEHVAGMDVVEVNPLIDLDSADLAAQIIWSFLAGLTKRLNLDS